jgi:hypothetical protein
MRSGRLKYRQELLPLIHVALDNVVQLPIHGACKSLVLQEPLPFQVLGILDAIHGGLAQRYSTSPGVEPCLWVEWRCQRKRTNYKTNHNHPIKTITIPTTTTSTQPTKPPNQQTNQLHHLAGHRDHCQVIGKHHHSHNASCNARFQHPQVLISYRISYNAHKIW